MVSENCKKCGARLDKGFYLCPNCGAKRPDEELLSSPNMAYNADDSDAARRFYNGILKRDRKNAQAYWGLFLLDMGAKDGILNKGPMKFCVSADSYLAMNLTEELYTSIVLNPNYLRAASLADGELKRNVNEFSEWLEERHGELEKARPDPKFKARTDGLRDYFAPLSITKDEAKHDVEDDPKSDIPTMGLDMGALFLQYLKDTGQSDESSDDQVAPPTPTPAPEKESASFDPYAAAYETHKKSSNAKSNGAKTTPKKTTPPVKPKSGTKSKTTAKSTSSASRKSVIFAGDIVLTVVCCIPIILELLLVLLIPHISFLAKIDGVAKWGWNALSVPMKASFISVIVCGFLVQTLGLLDKLNKPLGAVTQIVTFGLFVLAVFAAHNNAASAYTQWGMAIMVPVSLLVTTFRYVTYDGFGFLDDFNFWFYLPIALEIAEYLLFFLIFPLMFGVSASLWTFIALTVTTVAAIAVSSFWEDFRWAAMGINLAVTVLLCVIFWLGQLWNSEWLWNGGIITVVILAIGGSWFIHWFIHRNDP
ncbi:MAG: zinc ribbon domain-containing protein [Clostridiales bacterium]|nr:zinc ribbon domain-containing protein [Clostridiales bacterium]